MKDFLLFTLLGLGSGVLFAGLALSIVLTFRGAGVVNLAAGAQAMLGAYIFYDLRVNGDIPLFIPFAGPALDLGNPWGEVPAFLAALLVCAALAVFIDGVIFRRLRSASTLAKLVATLGLLLTLQAIIILRFGGDSQSAPAVLSESTVDVFGVPVPINRFILTGLVAVVTISLTLLYRYSKFGVATRAAQENEESAMLTGLSPDRLSMINTVMGAVLAGAVGILVAPIAQLDPLILTFAVIPALAAALIAGFTSFSVAALAALGVGIVQSLIIWMQTKSWYPQSAGSPLAGVADVFFFLVIVVVLFWRGASLPERGRAFERRLPKARAVHGYKVWMLGFTAAVVVLLIVFPFDYRQALINSLIGGVVCLSFVVLTGYVGQMSLLQAALSGVTALIVTKLSTSGGVGFPLAPIMGILAALAVGLIAAASALRVRGVSLAIVTMAAALAIERFWFANPAFGITDSSKIGDPSIFGLGIGTHAKFFGINDQPSPMFGLVCLLVLVVSCLAVLGLRNGELGRRMLAVRSNESAAAAAGISVPETKLAAYAISSTLAGVAGVLYAYDYGSVSVSRFALAVALSLIAFSYLGGITSVVGALIGGFLVTEGLNVKILNEVFGIPPSYQLIFGGFALIITIVQFPEGIAGMIAEKRQEAARKREKKQRAEPVAASAGASK